MVEYNKVKMSDLVDILEIINTAVKGKDSRIVLMGCLAGAIIAQDPTIDAKRLVETVKTVSEYMALALSPQLTTSIN